MSEEYYSIEEDLEETMKCLKETQKQLQQKENIIKEVREYINTDKNCVPKHIKDYVNNLLDKGE